MFYLLLAGRYFILLAKIKTPLSVPLEKRFYNTDNNAPLIRRLKRKPPSNNTR